MPDCAGVLDGLALYAKTGEGCTEVNEWCDSDAGGIDRKRDGSIARGSDDGLRGPAVLLGSKLRDEDRISPAENASALLGGASALALYPV